MKFILAGYFGFGNFGDEAILKYFVDVLRFYYKDADISVICENSYIIKKNLSVNAFSRFDFKCIFKKIKDCDFLIFPGGSVLQDITSLKSIFYYLLLIGIAICLKKKFLMMAQGVGPINNKIVRKITYKLLKKATLITVRDEKTYDTLMQNGVMCYLTTDFLWAFTRKIAYIAPNESMIYGDVSCCVEKKKVGIQLRSWPDLTSEKIDILAQNILKNFSTLEFDFKLICLQKSLDRDVLVELGKKMQTIKPEINIELCIGANIEENIQLLQEIDYMIAMRFHAGLCTINAEKALLMISYDPKTAEFCRELGLKFIDIKELNVNTIQQGLIWLKEFNPTRTALKTEILVKKSQENVDFLVKEIL